MPRDDREQNFEKALAGSLHSSNAAPGNDCLDAETLAAYHDRLLDPDEMAQRKTHIASCERCQEILAQLETTDGIAVEADRDLLLDQIILDIPETEPAAAAAPPAELQSESQSLPEPQSQQEELQQQPAATPPLETPAGPAPTPEPEQEIEHDPDLVAASAAIPMFHRVEPKTPAPAILMAAAAKSMPATSTITFRTQREGRPKMVRFIAIAGALAAGLIFWLVYRDQTKSVDIAQNRAAGKLELPPESPAPAARSAENKPDAGTSSSQTSELNGTPVQSSNAAAAVAAQAQPKANSAQPGAEKDSATNSFADAKKTLDSAKALQDQTRLEAIIAAKRADERAARDQGIPPGSSLAPGAVLRTAPNTNARKLDTSNETSIDSAIAAAKLPSGIPATPPPARTKMNPGVVTDSIAGSGATTPVSQSITPASIEPLSKPTNGRIAAALTPLSVPAPSGTTIWRIGQAGVIQRSTDGGTTWSIQPSGIVADLIAGSAYSDQVCWLVGRNGTILRTTNGGATWQKLKSPSNVDLLAVFSINADSATVTDAAGRAFETTTAGDHWTRTRLQQ